MKLKITLLIAAFASLFASAIYAGRATDGNAKIIYWQAPSILNPYLSSGTKDIESASLVIEPLGRYDETGALVPWLAEEIPTVGNGGVSSDLTTITSLVTVFTNAFFLPFLLIVSSIDDPTGPLISLTASIKDFPCT